MSGLGPAGCWMTHKRLEHWAKAAKERAFGHSPQLTPSSVTKPSEEATTTKDSQTVQLTQYATTHLVTNELLKSSDGSSLSSGNSHGLQHQSRSCPGIQPTQTCRTPSISSQSSVESGPSRTSHRGSSPHIRTFAPDGRSITQSENLPMSSRSPSPLRAVSFDARTDDCQHQLQRSQISRCLSPLHIHSTSPKHGFETDLTSNVSVVVPASPLGAIQPNLYLRSQEPLLLTGSPNDGVPLGKLHFHLKYDFDKSDLIVHLIEVQDLLTSDDGGFTDPYVRLGLEPEIDTRIRQTAIKRDELNPFFNQKFKFPISYEELQGKQLLLQVFDYDRYSRNSLVGEVRMGLDEFRVNANLEVWGDIVKNKKTADNLPEILVSLSYLPAAERLTVVLLKAKNLYLPQGKEELDPFVKVYLLLNDKRIKKKKTAVKKACSNPTWNEALNFSLPSNCVSLAAIEVCVLDQTSGSMGGTSSMIGCCAIGPKEAGPERDHWLDMVENPRKAMACWHVVK